METDINSKGGAVFILLLRAVVVNYRRSVCALSWQLQQGVDEKRLTISHFTSQAKISQALKDLKRLHLKIQKIDRKTF